MLLQLQNVSGGYGKGDIVKNVSCEADEGDILSISSLWMKRKPKALGSISVFTV